MINNISVSLLPDTSNSGRRP